VSLRFSYKVGIFHVFFFGKQSDFFFVWLISFLARPRFKAE